MRRVPGLDDACERSAHFGNCPARRAEVEQHGGAVGAHDDVVGGYIAMQEVLGVHHVQRIEKGGDDAIELLLPGRSAKARQPGFERLARLEIHHHVGGRQRLEYAGNAYDAGMSEACEGLRFLEKARPTPFERLSVPLGLWPHAHRRVAVTEIGRVVFLEGNPGSQLDVFGLVGDAEAA